MALTFGTFLAGLNVQYTFLDATSPVIGISFLLILLRLNVNKPGSSTVTHSATGRGGTTMSYPLRTINVSVARQIDIDSDLESKAGGKRSYGDAI